MLRKALFNQSQMTACLSRRSTQANSFIQTPTFNHLFGQSVITQRCFSQFFEELDKASREKQKWEFYTFKEWKTTDDRWRVPLARKKAKRALQKTREKAMGPADPEPPILYVHDAEQGVSLPAHPEGIYAVFRLGNRQHKVAKDDRVMVELFMGDDAQVGQQICLEDVLLVGTKDYTAVGRPQVTNARVYATIEEQTQTSKVLFYKLKRRKGYQRSGGHRQTVNVLRIDHIEHEVSEVDFVSQDGNVALMQKPTGMENFIL